MGGTPREAAVVLSGELAPHAGLAASAFLAATLLPGSEPLISRYTRFDYGRLPPDLGAYTRALTVLWAVLLAGFAAAQGAALASGGHLSASAILAAEKLAGKVEEGKK